MPFTPLATKFYIPPVRAGVVTRTRLIEKLLAGVQQPGSFVLISGPAGFGKTTLLSKFAAQVGQPVAWLSLDEAENDPNRFWMYLIAACQTVLREVGETALALLRAPQPLPEETIPSLLINDLASQHGSFVLVLDDYHTIQNPAIQAGLLFLMEHLPSNLHVILSTRSDPPWPLTRFRARNQLTEIRAQDLRFRPDEAEQFLNHTMGLSLCAELLAALEQRTEGWVAGLQLAAISMQGRSDTEAFVEAFTGSHVYIAEYLVDEVLKQQTEEVQQFLLQTSILDRLNAGLCAAVTGRPHSDSLLKTLQKANIFIIPLDDAEQWFRYHHLFAELLKARLHSSLSKSALAELHQRAANWLGQNGLVAEAVKHGLAGADYELVVRLVEEAALPMIIQANVQTVEQWLRAIPTDLLHQSPRINMAAAWMYLLRGTPDLAAPFIRRLQGIFSARKPGPNELSLQAEWLALQAELLISQGRPEESRDVAIQAQQMLPGVDPNVRSILYTTLAKAYQLTFDYNRAAEVFQMIVEDARRSGDIAFEVLGTSGQAQMLIKQGRLHQTHEIVTEAILRLERSARKVPFSATLFGEVGLVYFHWHQLDQARAYLRRSMEISQTSSYSDPEIYYHILLSKISLMEGDPSGAARAMEQASHLADRNPPAMIRENVLAQKVWVALAVDRLTEAEALLAAEGFLVGDISSIPELADGAPVTTEAGLLYNSALRLLLYRSKQEQRPHNLQRAITLAERVVDGELQSQQLPAALETLLLLSQFYAVQNDTSRSLAAITKALQLAQPEGFISCFLEEGQPVASMLRELLAGNLPEEIQPAYINEILAAYPHHSPPVSAINAQPPAVQTAVAAAVPLVEPLSAREQEILQLIAAGYSNQAIAKMLTITISAVKKHAGNIYGKLNVNSRTQAIARARQIGLL